MISTSDGRLRDHGEEVGQHRLADLIDPVRVLDDDRAPGSVRASDAAFISAVNRRRRASGSIWGSGTSGSAMPSRSSSSSRSSRVGVGNLVAHPIAGGLRRRDPSTPVAARSSRATAWKGISLVCDSQKAENTSTPATGRHRRDLAQPAGSCRCPAVPPRRPHAPWPLDRAVQQAVDGGHLPAADRPDSTRHARPRDAARRCASSRRAAHRFVGALDVHHLRFSQQPRRPRPVARWTR